ncbi:NitT/TauT family transport system substrate-binding protein [Amycolatopsis sulphurea]|uniref:NitT/TauT family transport system substrate-binding protein n=2 Tax=Amycolatopsis sulphurea TaxID=76022 RepID=A0A2A9FEI6_9PSEU|nr:NitT/TauT family transport system substrate-binding protein [Amycolatopsis sulphurea]
MFEAAAGNQRSYGRRGFLSLAMASGVALTASGCGLLGGSEDSGGTGGGSGLEKPKIKVSIMPTIDVAPFHLAVQNGYFQQEGLEVEAVNAASGGASLQKLLAGEVDIAYGSYTPFFIAKSKSNADIKFVADASSAGPKSTEVVALPNGPVKSVHDLAGKKIAITATDTICDTLTKSVMRDNGVDYSGVKWVPIGFPQIGAAVKRGDVDAGFLTEPFITQSAKDDGTVEIIDAATGGTKDFPTAGYASLGKFASGSQKTVAAFQRAMLKATKESADRSKIEPLLVKFSKVDQDIAALTKLLTFQSTLDARRLQRVPDLLQQFQSIPAKIDVATMIVPQASAS